jgi:hypothetical protein
MNIDELAAKFILDIELDIETEDFFDYENTIEEALKLLEELKQENDLREDKFIRDLHYESDKWVFWNGISAIEEVFDFTFVEEYLTFVKHIDTSVFKNVLKCWVIHRLAKDNLSPTSAETYFKHLTEAILKTHVFIEDGSDSFVKYIKTLKLADGPKRQRVLPVLNFLSFYDDIDLSGEYTQELYRLVNNLKAKKKSRLIPSGLNIFRFSKILEDYFETVDKKSELYIHFFPLLLWWKITTIIPLRPFEFCNIVPDCLDYVEEKCYLLLPRLKGPHKETKNVRRKQIIDKILIPKEIENLIKEYWEIIKPYGHTKRKTLISRLVYEKTLIKKATVDRKKRDNNNFLTPDLGELINRFYDVIIAKDYGLSSNKLPPVGRKAKVESESKIENFDLIRVRSIDTRHIAFINMLAQGWSKPEIARFGGHLVLETQELYQNHREYWIEEETRKMIQKFKLGLKVTSIKDSGDSSENINGLSLSMRLEADFKKKFVLRPALTDPAKHKKLILGKCTDPLQACKTHCLHCDYWRISQEEFEEKQEQLLAFIRECDNHIHGLLAVLKDLQRFVFEGELNIEVAEKILSSQKQIDEEIFKRASLLYNLERSNVGA